MCCRRETSLLLKKTLHIMSNKNRFLLLYGSQTGQAEAIAEEIQEDAENHGLKADLFCLSQTEKKFNIVDEKCVVFVVSTTGDGDPPDNATKFYRRLKKKTLPNDHLKQLKYTLLGLGDSNYSNFCNNGKNFDKRLNDLGGQRFYPSGFADDAVGLEIVVEPWIEGLWKALRQELKMDHSNHDDVQTENLSKELENIKLVENEQTDSLIEVSETERTKRNETEIDAIIPNKEISNSNTVNQNLLNDQSVNQSGISSNTTNEETVNDQSVDQSQTSSHKTNQETLNNQSKASIEIQNLQEANEKYESAVDDKKTDTVNRGDDSDVSQAETPIPSLKVSTPPLSESGLTLPPSPHPYIGIQYISDAALDVSTIPLQGGANFPSCNSEVVMATIMSAERLTSSDALKTCLRIKLDITGTILSYQPGDSIGIVCPNMEEEVDFLIRRLSILDEADKPITLHVLKDTKKKRALLPEYIPAGCSIRHAILTCLDIRNTPKKALLRMLVDYTTNTDEKRRLQELCSRQGAQDYEKWIRCCSLSITDILVAFPSCNPPIERLFELLPRLQPRPYSAASSPLAVPGCLEFAFNIVEIPAGDDRHCERRGVCTGWLNRLTSHLQDDTKVEDKIQIPIFSRTNQYFHLPSDVTTPIIMIGPGTGVAPFRGFLQHRQYQRQQTPTEEFGQTWLLFGCRHRNKDHIFRTDLSEFVDNGTLSRLCVCFSRDRTEDEPRYVQDLMRIHRQELAQLVIEKKAVVYVCGDAKHMAKDVKETWTQIIADYLHIKTEDAESVLKNIREEKRYLEDIWT
uniref:Methionine synthase reductase n=1 Tax=Saccoglossus kowalevskii TaxID=10224 RepID=A0ABM0H132_SACKO|nr:PREDICTED: methionine synthase reductase-like [Saccoglossus kowalevskii]